jgi:mannose-6-phosphate isomerase-like protein (cupin superfamily)
MSKVNLREKFNKITKHWTPHIVGELNGQNVKLAKFKGEFPRHKHETEDEMFLVISGSFLMEYDDGSEIISEGEFIIVPKGVYHRPIAESEAEVLLFEPIGTLNTGNLENDLTIENPEKI